MSESVEHPTHDPSADEELSTSLEGHSDLPDDGDGTGSSEDGDGAAVLEEIDDSPVRTKNS